MYGTICLFSIAAINVFSIFVLRAIFWHPVCFLFHTHNMYINCYAALIYNKRMRQMRKKWRIYSYFRVRFYNCVKKNLSNLLCPLYLSLYHMLPLPHQLLPLAYNQNFTFAFLLINYMFTAAEFVKDYYTNVTITMSQRI